MLFDLPLEQLREYRPQRDEPSDFDAFWSSTLAPARRHPLAAQFEPYDVGLTTVESFGSERGIHDIGRAVRAVGRSYVDPFDAAQKK